MSQENLIPETEISQSPWIVLIDRKQKAYYYNPVNKRSERKPPQDFLDWHDLGSLI